MLRRTPTLYKTVLVLAVLVGSGCESGSKPGRVAAVAGSDETIDTLTRDLAIWIPPSSVVLGVDRDTGADRAVRAKLKMTPDQAQEFIGKLPVPPDSVRSNAGGTLAGGAAWWRPPRAMPVTRIPLEGARVLKLGLDASEEHVTYVYVVNSAIR